MKIEAGMVRVGGGAHGLSAPRYLMGLILGLAFLCMTPALARAHTSWPQIVLSRDGTPISYEIAGAGEPTLVFVHGWSCDARYWRAQVRHFSKKRRVVILDLAGHGHSGAGRTSYTMAAFGEDVQAVVQAVGGKVILIGHSMGGAVIAEAARRLPGRVIGLIGIDTFDNIEYPLTRAELDKMLAPFEKDFRSASRQFVGEMLYPRSDPKLRAWILADMAAAPPAVAVSAMRAMMEQYITGQAARIFEDLRLPVITVNGDLWPIDYAANRRHMLSYDAIVLKQADHFLMLDKPAEFNRALEKAIRMLLEKSAPERSRPSPSGGRSSAPKG